LTLVRCSSRSLQQLAKALLFDGLQLQLGQKGILLTSHLTWESATDSMANFWWKNEHWLKYDVTWLHEHFSDMLNPKS
jgi:hypothetical protein